MSKRLNHPILENYKNGIMITYPVPDKRLDKPMLGIYYEKENSLFYSVNKVHLDKIYKEKNYIFKETEKYRESFKETIGNTSNEDEARRLTIKTAMQEIIRTTNCPYSKREFLDKRSSEGKLVKLAKHN